MKEDKKKRTFYETLVKSHSEELHRFASRLSGRMETAEDLLQETFYEAWRSLKSLRKPERARSWLFQILRHRWGHWQRDQSRRIAPTASLNQAVTDPGLAREDETEALSLRDVLQYGLDALDNRYKESFLLVFMEGFTCREAAERLELPLGTVLSRIHKARSFLKRVMEGQAAEPAEEAERSENKKKMNRPIPLKRYRMGDES